MLAEASASVNKSCERRIDSLPNCILMTFLEGAFFALSDRRPFPLCPVRPNSPFDFH
jgi:hypothetical protein